MLYHVVFPLSAVGMERLYEASSGSFSLNGSWTLWFGSQEDGVIESPEALQSLGWKKIKATVPGNVELDLLAAGVIADPQKGDNVYELQKYEKFQWLYHRRFTTPKIERGQRIHIHFEGLDCLGTIWINDHYVGDTENMLIPHEFDITDYLKTDSENDIYVHIRSAVLEGSGYPSAPLEFALPGKWEALNIRKAAHMYGWDIMPRIVSAGLWRDVSLRVRDPNYFRSVYWATQSVDISKNTAKLLLDWDFCMRRGDLDGMKINVMLTRNAKVVYKEHFPVLGTRDKLQIDLNQVAFWWPRNFGDQPLYEASVQLVDNNQKVLAEHVAHIGIRTIDLIRTNYTAPDSPGCFYFLVNGEKIFIKGTNWVPLDAFHSRDREHLQEVFAMLVDLNCNMIRCWGGNVYEGEEFYSFCDRNGILVWQDFSMGCGRYPQRTTFFEKIREEAETIVPKLRNHPSLALWAGNNENDVALTWIGMDHIDPNTDRISREILKDVVRELDPMRPYLPSSPYVSPEVFQKGFDKKTMPEVHLWGPRGYFKAPFYTDVWAHFVSEIGYHGCPVRASLEQMMDPEFVYPWDEDGNWNAQWTTKAVAAFPEQVDFGQSRNNLMIKQIRDLFGEVPEDLDAFILASQAVQAEAKKFFIESWRMRRWQRSGILWWNLRDGWPIISDAIVDYYNRKKLAYEYIKRSQEDICVMFDEEMGGAHDLVVVNDTRAAVEGHLKVRDLGMGGIIFESSFTLEANGKLVLTSLKPKSEQGLWIVEWTLSNGSEGRNHYIYGKPPFSIKEYESWLGKILNKPRDG